jgi:hypothetical protein
MVRNGFHLYIYIFKIKHTLIVQIRTIKLVLSEQNKKFGAEIQALAQDSHSLLDENELRSMILKAESL